MTPTVVKETARACYNWQSSRNVYRAFDEDGNEVSAYHVNERVPFITGLFAGEGLSLNEWRAAIKRQ